MPTQVILPKVDMDMATGTIFKWHVKEGHTVKKGALLFEIETDKATMEIECPADGVIRDITAAEGAVIPVGQVVALIHGEGEATAPHIRHPGESRDPSVSVTAPQSPSPVQAQPWVPASAGMTSGGTGIRSTPLARRLARESAIDLKSLKGSGPRGRIVAGDVARPQIVTSVFHLSVTCDLARLNSFNAEAIAIRALATALKRVAAASSDVGLFAKGNPVIRAAESKSLTVLARELKEPVSFAIQENQTIAIAWLDIEQFTGTPTPAHSGVLAMGAARDSRVVCTLSCDPARIDQAVAAGILRNFQTLVEDPLLMLA